MSLDSIIQFMIPRDRKFFPLFTKAAETARDAARLLLEVAVTQPGETRDRLVQAIDQLENVGDQITHDIYLELNTNFITPLDRGDIHALAKCLDDVTDHINLSAYALNMYNIVTPPREYLPLAQNIAASTELIVEAIRLLSNRKSAKAIQDLCVRINSLENEADGLFVNGMSRLFREETDPINLIRQKETLIALELATDMAEDVANVLDGITIKIA
jgi:uncharacterized protein